MDLKISSYSCQLLFYVVFELAVGIEVFVVFEVFIIFGHFELIVLILGIDGRDSALPGSFDFCGMAITSAWRYARSLP